MLDSVEKLDLAPGDPLQLPFVPDDGRPRLHVQVIGLLDGGSVLVTAPTEHHALVLLREGQASKLVLRAYVYENLFGDDK